MGKGGLLARPKFLFLNFKTAVPVCQCDFMDFNVFSCDLAIFVQKIFSKLTELTFGVV